MELAAFVDLPAPNCHFSVLFFFFFFSFLSLAAETIWSENGDHCRRYASFSPSAVCLFLLNVYTEARLLKS